MFQAVMNQDGEHYHQQRGLYHLWQWIGRCHEEEQQPKNYRANDGASIFHVESNLLSCVVAEGPGLWVWRGREGEEETKEVAIDDVIKAATKFLTSSRFSRITLSKKPKDEEDVAEEEEMAVTKDAKNNVDTCEWLVSRCLRRRIVMTRPAMLLWIIKLSFTRNKLFCNVISLSLIK